MRRQRSYTLRLSRSEFRGPGFFPENQMTKLTPRAVPWRQAGALIEIAGHRIFAREPPGTGDGLHAPSAARLSVELSPPPPPMCRRHITSSPSTSLATGSPTSRATRSIPQRWRRLADPIVERFDDDPGGAGRPRHGQLGCDRAAGARYRRAAVV